MGFKTKPSKTLKCSQCETPVHNVGHDAEQVLCWHCVAASLQSGPIDILDDAENNSPKILPDQS